MWFRALGLRPASTAALSPLGALCYPAKLTQFRIRFDRPKVTNYLVDRVEIGHDVCTSGNGVTDHLRFKGPGHSSKAVVAFEYRHIYVYPSLAGPAIKYGCPRESAKRTTRR
jgi:hypothetical protein